MAKDTKEHLDLVEKFCRVNDVYNLTTAYPLDKSSVVFDVGAYLGTWAMRMHSLYACSFYCFEPVKNSFATLQNTTEQHDNIVPLNYALGPKNRKRNIHLQKDGSSFFIDESGECETVDERDIIEVMDELNLTKVDFLKINIEGAEFDLLDHLIANNRLKDFKHIQIQYHREVSDFDARRIAIQNEMSKTHKVNYDYEFVWESWSIIS